MGVGLALSQAEVRPESAELQLYRGIAADIGLGIVCYPVGSSGSVLERSDQARLKRFRDVRSKLIVKEGVEPVRAIDEGIDLTNSETSYIGCPSDSAERRRRSRLRYNLQKLNNRLRGVAR